MNDQVKSSSPGALASLVGFFISSKLPVLLMIFAVVAGLSAVFLTPREEDPQIVVPLANVFVEFPGASAEEVEKLVATPLERLLWQIDGVEYVYSMSRRDLAVVTVRFFVGEDLIQSLVRLHNKITMNIDEVPPGVKGWIIKPIEIDDVSIVNLTLYSNRYNDHELHRMGGEILARLEGIEDISRTSLVGGRKREIRVELDREKMTGFSISPLEALSALQRTDVSVTAGAFSRANREMTVVCDAFLMSREEVEDVVVGVREGSPIHVRDIATVLDGPEEIHCFTRIGFSHRHLMDQGLQAERVEYGAVTLALAKKKGTNAVRVADNILKRLEELQENVIPHGVRVEVTRNYGETAQQKVDDLLTSLIFAIITVVGLIMFTMGWREGLVVGITVPLTFAMALFVNYLTGYTINRVTLFALILSLGLVVDDPITNVDNIQRHILEKKRDALQATLFAVNEVLPPVILSTLAIIVSFLPMFFITGMMGPYMAPMAINVPLAVTFSTVNALVIVPWLCYHLLRNMGQEKGPGQPSSAGTSTVPHWVRKGYHRILYPFLGSSTYSLFLIGGVILLLLASISLPAFRLVPLKMLPFDNKNEFQLVVDMKEGTTLETTDRAVRALEDYLRTIPEVTTFVSYVGTASPMDFNGLVRQYYLRQGSHMADIRVNLAPKENRQQQSHDIVLRIRQDLHQIARDHDVALKVVEIPPGPPVIATLAGEIYGTPDKTYEELVKAAAHVRRIMEEQPGVVDVDDTVEARRDRLDFVIDREKSSLHGVTPEQITQTLKLALSGVSAATVHLPHERQPLRINLILPRKDRSGEKELARISVKTSQGHMVELGELGHFVMRPEEQTIYHKNLERLVYVFGEMAGQAPVEAILDIQSRLREEPLPPGTWVLWTGEGEWHITLQVFRDLGIAFGVALLGIYLLLIIQTGSYSIPLVIMMAIPLTLVGIMPGFWLLNLLTSQNIGGYDSLVYFTATAMIGMIALGGIVVRNSIVLIQFIDGAVKEGLPFKEAILESGAVRLRPIVLTAVTTALGAWPITLDPIFSGLAWALIFGLFASTCFTLVIIPVVYYLVYRKKYERSPS